MKTPRLFFAVAMSSCLLASVARAHPVAQGAMTLRISTNAIYLRARVSTEEAIVANTFATGASKASSLPQLWKQHGEYLLEHINVTADDHRLTGTVAAVDSSQNNFLVYDFAYPVATRPQQVRVRENVLNEIEFAPGNPWEATFVVSAVQEGQTLQEGLLLSRTEPFQINCDWNPGKTRATASLNKTHMISQYIRHGIGHILTGYDHLLFVCALVLTAVTLLDLIKVITAFTVAHTITLVLSVLNIVRLPSHIVEPMIAGSIVFVALTNVFSPRRSRGNLRIATAFFFGLFHGLGFAGGLLDAMAGLNGLAIGLAIGAFSLGVEIGHQMVVLPVFFGLRFARTTLANEEGRERLSLDMTRAGSLIISIFGTLYLMAALRG
jgi:hydrogenase/urease accessory protein HupE